MKIKDIAKLAGVSPATISRVLNNNGYVSKEKRLAVEKVINDVNYQRNEIAKSLKNQKSQIIGVIVPKISTETASRVVEGITTVVKEHNYQVIIGNTNMNINEEIDYLRFLSNKLVDGIIMMGTELTPKHMQLINQLEIPFVIIGQYIPKYMSVVHNDYEASKQMVEYLIGQGHKRIALIGVDPKDEAVGVIRKKAFFDTLKKAEIDICDDQIIIGDFDIKSGYKNMGILLKRYNPTAVFAVTDNLAIGAIRCIQDCNLNVPNDISVVGIGDTKVSKYINPPLTTIHYKFKTSGEIAASELLKMMKNHSNRAKKIVVGYEFEERCSVKNLN